ncbi:hypothetical protein [Streptomyces sp. NPDC054765]
MEGRELGRVPAATDEVLEDRARDVVAWHTLADIEENRPYRDSDTSVPELLLLLGSRCRAVAAGRTTDAADDGVCDPRRLCGYGGTRLACAGLRRASGRG